MIPSATQNPTAPATTTYHTEPPKLLMASTNLTLAYIMQCREAISYLPLPWPHSPSERDLAPEAGNVKLNSNTRTTTKSRTAPPPRDTPHPLSHPAFPPHTLFSQSALIFSTGMFASTAYPPIGIDVSSPIPPLEYPRAATAPQRAAGRKVELWGKDRFESNAETGRSAMMDAAERVWKSMN